MRIVIGSGPAGIAAAVALVRRGFKVTIIDGGMELEPELVQLKNKLAHGPQNQWTAEDLQRFKQGSKASTRGVGQKNSFGSDYVYRLPNRARAVSHKNAHLLRSFAPGGLSNVWGASILPYIPSEISNWPVAYDELAESYREVLSFMPSAGVRDELEGVIPLLSANTNPLTGGSQAAEFISKIDSHRAELRSKGMTFGQPHLAVRNHDQVGTQHACRYCSLCLYGCPYDLIYSSQHTLADLMRQGKIDYLPGIVIEKFQEEGEQVLLHGRSKDGELKTFKAEKVYLAAGALESTRILMESLKLFGQTVLMKHSEFFMMPFLRFRRTKGCMDQAGHTLSQLFCELVDPKLSPFSVHMQFYGYNDFYLQALKQALGRFDRLFTIPVRALVERLFMIFGYIHSDHSSSMAITLNRSGSGVDMNGPEASLNIAGVPAKESPRIARQVYFKFLGSSRQLGGIAFPPRVGIPGDGNHSGGSFPMSRSPGRLECDVLGRPSGLRHLHVVDSTVFPSVPATTITLTVMANAHRIATYSE